jgi:hypothetical protein
MNRMPIVRSWHATNSDDIECSILSVLGVSCVSAGYLPYGGFPRADNPIILVSDLTKLKLGALLRAALNNGYADIHDLKRGVGLGSESDIYKDAEGNLFGLARGGSREPQDLFTHISGRPPE